MTPTLWPGFSPSWLQPDNFLASKAIWYPAARKRCGSNREARAGPRAPGNRKDILCPLLARGIPPRQLRETAKPSTKVLQCWAKPPACLVDKTQGTSFAACGPGQLQNGQQENQRHMYRVQEPAHTPYCPPGRRCFPTSTSHRTQLRGKPICTNKAPDCQTQESKVT